MTVLCVFLIFTALCQASEIKEWMSFKMKFRKEFKNATEDFHRMKIYLKNTKFIYSHNREYYKGRKPFYLSVNQFCDMTNREFKSLITKLKRPQHNINEAGMWYKSSNKPLPDAIDWREKGAVTQVKSQGKCGSCWAFSAVGAIEAQAFMKTEKLVPLSEQSLLDCTLSYGNDGCMGGFLTNTFQYVVDQGGIVTEESYPYEGEVGKCRFAKENVAATVLGYTQIPEGDEVSLRNAVAQTGPVSAGIHADTPSFQFYGGGVYENTMCNPNQINHAILVIGFGTANNTDFWTLKNSMGRHWGEDGYMRIKRNSNNHCGIASVATYPLV